MDEYPNGWFEKLHIIDVTDLERVKALVRAVLIMPPEHEKPASGASGMLDRDLDAPFGESTTVSIISGFDYEV